MSELAPVRQILLIDGVDVPKDLRTADYRLQDVEDTATFVISVSYLRRNVKVHTRAAIRPAVQL